MSGAILVWLVVGACLIGAELMTGTFYLLIFGIAAWVGAAAAYLNYGLTVQLIAVGVVALIGLAVLIPYDMRRRARRGEADVDIEVGNDVRVESSATNDPLRVSYRGSSWAAVVESGFSSPKPGDVCVITAVRGNTLVVRLKQ